MGRSLVLSFLILSVIFYTMGRPKNDTGTIDYIHSVKNHDFSPNAVEKRFFNALKPRQDNAQKAYSGLGKQQETRISSIVQDRIEKKDPRTVQAKNLTLREQQALEKLPLLATPTKKPERLSSLFRLPSYLPFREMVESTITLKGSEPKDTLAQNKRTSVKVARIVPQKAEDGLMDFLPLEHVYTPQKTQTSLKIMEKTATTKTIKTVALPKKPRTTPPKQKVVIASLPQNPATLITLPVRRAALPKKTKRPVPPNKTVVAALQQDPATLMALPVKRAASKSNNGSQAKASTAKPKKKTAIASLQKQKLTQHRLQRKKNAARKWRTIRRKKARLLQARHYAQKRKRTRSLMRQLQTKLARRKANRSRAATLPVQTKGDSAKHPAQTHIKKVMARQNKKAFQGRVNRKKKRLASLNRSLRRKKINHKNRVALRHKLRQQRKKAGKSRRNRRNIIVVRQPAKAYTRRARLKRVITRNNNKAFQNKIRRQRRSAQIRRKNKRILRRIDRKLGKKRFGKQRTVALRQQKRRKRFVRQRLRRRNVKRKTIKKYRAVRRTRVARRRPARQPWHQFNFDGTMGGD